MGFGDLTPKKEKEGLTKYVQSLNLELFSYFEYFLSRSRVTASIIVIITAAVAQTIAIDNHSELADDWVEVCVGEDMSVEVGVGVEDDFFVGVVTSSANFAFFFCRR